jgi:uncharacterized protein
MSQLTRKFLSLGVLCTLALGVSALAAAPKNSAHLPGKFIWFDLATPDLTAAQSFYGAVFGWEFAASANTDGYTLIHQDGRDIGALFVPPKTKTPAGSRWVSLLSVSDAAVAVQQVADHGGKVLIKPTSLGWRGTHALVRDADGALFGLLQANTDDAADVPVADGDFFWVDLLTPAPVKAAAFYRAVAGYEVTDEKLGEGIDRIVLSSGGFARAGIAPLPETVQKPGWLPYVLVRDVQGTLDKAVKAGGKVLLAPRADLLDGQLAVFADPNGAVLGLVNWTNNTQK